MLAICGDLIGRWVSVMSDSERFAFVPKINRAPGLYEKLTNDGIIVICKMPTSTALDKATKRIIK